MPKLSGEFYCMHWQNVKFRVASAINLAYSDFQWVFACLRMFLYKFRQAIISKLLHVM